MPGVTEESGAVPPAARRVLLKLSGETNRTKKQLRF